jgi:hypothetical protein
MRTTPTTALIAVISSAAGLLASWYTPVPLLPALVFGVLAYVLAAVGLAAAFRQDRDSTLTGATLLVVRATAVTLQTLAGAALHLLAALEAALQQWRTDRPASTTRIHAA